VPTFVLGLSAVALVAANVVAHRDQPLPVERDLATARAILQDEKGNVERAYSLAEKALAYGSDSAVYQAQAHLLLGLASARLAENAATERAGELRQDAFAHFNQAEALGLPEEDRPRLAFAMGWLLFQTEGDPQEVVACLSRGVPEGTNSPSVGYGLLVQAYLRLPQPNLEAALEANRKQLDQGGNEKELTAARLARGDILVRLGKYTEAARTLERISAAAPTEMRIKALYLQAQAWEKAGQCARAVPLWQTLLQTPDQIPGGKPRALYSLGLCLFQANPSETAEARNAWQQAAQDAGEEGQAAAFRLAELDLTNPPPDLPGVLTELKRALAKVAGPKDYHNKLLDLERARQIFEAALRTALEGQAFEQAQELAELYGRLAAPGTAEERFAVAAEAGARQLEEKADKAGGDEGEVFRQESQAQWRTAATAAERAAIARGGEQPDLLWQAAEDFRRGRADDRAAAVLQRLVRLRLSPDRLAECWFNLAEAYHALDKKLFAREAFLECAKFSTSPFSYRARYQLALDMDQQARGEEAVDILEQNLNIIDPSRDRKTFEQSLYKVGVLLFQQGNFDKAWVRLKQAVREYPDNGEALAVRDQLGLCFRKLADKEAKKIQEQDDPVNHRPGWEEAKAHYERQRLSWLSQAEEVYQKLQEDLKARPGPLRESEARLLRRAAFAIADLELEANHFAEALRLYIELAQAYPKQIESLLACQGIGRCWTVLIKSSPDQAHEVLPQVQALVRMIQDDLPSIPDAAFPAETPREAWQDYFRRFLQHLERVAMAPRQGI
jgi:tetratricopeptide (TPR) repeat protein